ncbi:hypothetical protein Syun_015443 [Stephania yunnanensis]|uniref:ubiquitinyl hydrolase 1 n=1 Tax=Stephania yunnanensis TaxID=152371 RepID=A0AAP0JMW4_9MAGN
MLGPGDLGFPGLISLALLILFGGPIVSFVVQWRVRKAVERREEVLRLMAMASQESLRAEIEAAEESKVIGVVVDGGLPMLQCAVCYRPTATRCSRCKAVRYCSGKCQIMHWRQGHKHDCHPPGTAIQYNGAENDVNQSTNYKGEEPETCGNHLEGNVKYYSESTEVFSDECVPSITSLLSGLSASNATHEASADGSDSNASVSGIPEKSVGSQSDDINSHTFVKTTDFNSTKLPLALSTSVNSSLLSRKSRRKISNCSAGELDFVSINSSTSNFKNFNGISESSTCADFVDNNSSMFGGGMAFDGTASSMKASNLSTMGSNQNGGSLVMESEISGSRLSSVSEDHFYSSRREHCASSVKSSMADSICTVEAVTPEIAISSPNASNGLKTSTRKVALQLKVPKLSKQRTLGAINQGVFPFEMFTKLYNWEKVVLRPCGLVNCGNSCYANAVLQCLAFTQPLTAYFLQGLHSRTCPKKEWCFTCEFEYLVLKARDGKSPVSPIGILSKIESIGSHLGHGKEEDAHEFLRYAVESMQSFCLKEAGSHHLILLFLAFFFVQIQCLRCLGKSEHRERMMDLTVEIQGDIGTLEDALAKFTATEILDGENKYQCNRCKSYERAKKKLTILEAPNILTIAFKRFQSGKFGKLNKSVRFPETLNLAPYMSGEGDKHPIYRLYAVVVHLDIMNAAFSGHYVCYVKNIQGKWFKIDDSRVKPVEIDRVLSKGAYMLLYARCSPRAPSLMRDEMMSNGSKVKQDRSSAHVDTTNCCGKGPVPRRRSTSAVPRVRPDDHPYSLNLDGRLSFETSDLSRRQLQLSSRFSTADSSSDSSSLLSCSDEGSCSTDSTRDSTSTEDLSEYIFGESGHGWNSPWRSAAEDSNDHSSCSRRSPLGLLNRHDVGSPETREYSFKEENLHTVDKFSRRPHQVNRYEGLQKDSPPFLNSNTTRNCRKLTNCSCSLRETNSESDRLARVMPSNVKSNVSMRWPTLGRTAQTPY